MAAPAIQPPTPHPPATPPSRFRNGEVIFVSILFLVLPTFCALYFSPLWGWFIVALSMVVYLLFLGRWITGRPLGVLINERNLMSLSRFQMVSWTVLLLSAFFAVALKRLTKVDAAQALNIGMNWRLWALMGISATSLVGTPLVLSTKTDQIPDQKTLTKAANALGEDENAIKQNSQGTLYSNPDIRDAALTDMFQGDEVGNTAYLDVSKVQMFYFTIIAVIAYACVLFKAISLGSGGDAFTMPNPSDALVGLLGISHAAYLTSKTVQHS